MIRIIIFASGSGTNAENIVKYFKDSKDIISYYQPNVTLLVAAYNEENFIKAFLPDQGAYIF